MSELNRSSKLEDRARRRFFGATGMLGHLCALYDHEVWESARMMSNLAFQLTINRGKNVSLLKQLRVEESIAVLVDETTMQVREHNPLIGFGLGLKSNGFGKFEPKSFLVPQFMGPGTTWQPILVTMRDWLHTKILVSGRRSFSRCDVITLLRNQDGGAHCDTKLDSEYAALVDSFPVDKSSSIVGVGFDKHIAWDHLPEVPLVMMRQIAFELISSIYSQSDFVKTVEAHTIYANFTDESFTAHRPKGYPLMTVFGQEAREVSKSSNDVASLAFSYSFSGKAWSGSRD